MSIWHRSWRFKATLSLMSESPAFGASVRPSSEKVNPGLMDFTELFDSIVVEFVD